MEDERTADALRESEERYRTLFEQSPVGVFLFDRGLRIERFNARFVQILKSTDAALRGLDMRDLRDTRIVPALERALTGELGLYEGPYQATTSDAELVITMRLAPLRDRSGAVVGGLGVVEDVTAVRAAEAALRTSEGRLRALIELLPDGIVVYSLEGLLLYANPAVLQSLGYDPDEPLNARNALDVLHPDDRAKSLERRSRVLAGDRPPRIEYRIQRKDGTFAFVEAISIDIAFDGAPAVLTVLRDLTERRVIQAKLAQADRMVAVGTLAAGVAHEINNPLAYMKANLDVAVSRKLPQLERDAQALAEELVSLRQGAAPPDDATVTRVIGTIAQLKEMLGLALDGAERVRTIVSDLRTFSRDDDVPLMAVDVRRVLDAAINLAGSEIRQRARIVKQFDPVPPVRASEARLGQVFLNLLVNAAHAIPDDRVGEGEIRVYVGTDGHERAVVRVHDNGVGIEPHVLARIFDPFFTTKPASVGTGLGLWICRGIVDHLSGTIEVESAPGSGTTFTIRLPTSLGGGTEPPPSPSSPTLARGKLLVIDDEVAITQVLRGALEPDYAVTTVNSGNEALRILAERSDFDAVLCDLTMLGLSGMEVYAAAVRQRPALERRFLFITGGAFTPQAQAFVETHRARCIVKPFDIPSLRDRIAERILDARAMAAR